MLAPAGFVERDLAELDLRARTGVHVLLIRRPKGSDHAVRVPTSHDRIDVGDQLVVAGTRDALERLEHLRL